MAEVAYSTDEENYNFESLAEAIESMDDPQPGYIVYEGDVVQRPASHYWRGRRGLEWLLENLNEQAYDEAGEFAEDWPGNSITDEGEKALEVGIKALLDQHIKVSFYTVANVRRIELTAEMIADAAGVPPSDGGQQK